VYKKLGLEITNLGEDIPCRSKWIHMVDEKRDEKAGDPIKLLLHESLSDKVMR
jgi:hypothetical protein